MRWPWAREIDALRGRVDELERQLVGDESHWRDDSVIERLDALEGTVGELETEVDGVSDGMRELKRLPDADDIADSDDLMRLGERVGELESRINEPN